MNVNPRVLLLGGAHETTTAATWLANLNVTASVIWAEEATKLPLDVPYCSDFRGELSRASGLVDATHPFDTKTRATALGTAPRIHYARMWRAPWVPEPNDKWTEVTTIEAAVQALPSGARVFAATGRTSLPALSKHDGRIFLRQLNGKGGTSPRNCQLVPGTGPFDVVGEISLFEELRIDVVLCRNVGADGSFPKILAARRLGLPVVLLAPPEMPEGASIRSFADLASWVGRL